MSLDARKRLQDADTIEGEVVEDGRSAALAGPGTADDSEGQPDTRLEELERRTADLQEMAPKAV